MPMRYPSVRRQVFLRLRGGEPVVEIAAETGISPATLFRWKAQALIDAGGNDGVPSVEADVLAVGMTNASALLRLLPMSDRDRDTEILALRHQITVLDGAWGSAVAAAHSTPLRHACVPGGHVQ